MEATLTGSMTPFSEASRGSDVGTSPAAASDSVVATIKRTIAEGDLVVTHGLIRTSVEDRGTAVVDIFRLEDGKIVEHWDVLQSVPEESANDNGMV